MKTAFLILSVTCLILSALYDFRNKPDVGAIYFIGSILSIGFSTIIHLIEKKSDRLF